MARGLGFDTRKFSYTWGVEKFLVLSALKEKEKKIRKFSAQRTNSYEQLIFG